MTDMAEVAIDRLDHSKFSSIVEGYSPYDRAADFYKTLTNTSGRTFISACLGGVERSFEFNSQKDTGVFIATIDTDERNNPNSSLFNSDKGLQVVSLMDIITEPDTRVTPRGLKIHGIDEAVTDLVLFSSEAGVDQVNRFASLMGRLKPKEGKIPLRVSIIRDTVENCHQALAAFKTTRTQPMVA